MSDLTDLIGGASRKPITIPPVTPIAPVAPATVSANVITPPAYDLLLLLCGSCGANLSVGKTSSKATDKLKLKCPVCGTSYEKHNYIVDSNSVLFHRPFNKDQQVQFDKEIEKTKKSLKVQTEVLKTGNNQ